MRPRAIASGLNRRGVGSTMLPSRSYPGPLEVVGTSEGRAAAREDEDAPSWLRTQTGSFARLATPRATRSISACLVILPTGLRVMSGGSCCCCCWRERGEAGEEEGWRERQAEVVCLRAGLGWAGRCGRVGGRAARLGRRFSKTERPSATAARARAQGLGVRIGPLLPPRQPATTASYDPLSLSS